MTTTYAVVDIETTGTFPKEDRIIQVGLVLVKNREIVSTFSFLVNPSRSIPTSICKLTGITQKEVEKAPFFEEVAPILKNLIQDCVFVAHNIRFDLNFLNEEFQRVGLSKMKVRGIDTVELSQILFPTAPSYRLSDLANTLNIEHLNPHQADSDAYVTAKLLLLLEEKLEQLPVATLKVLSECSDKLIADNHLMIRSRYLAKKEKLAETYPDDLVEIEGIVLQKIQPLREIKQPQTSYPKTKKQKEKLFKNRLEYRENQAKFMNEVYKHLTQEEEKNLFLEAATGSGKTFAYLFALSFLATAEEKAIIATPSKLLQHQLLTVDVPMLNQLLPEALIATLVKSKRHYIDILAFQRTLQNPVKQKNYQIYQLGVLVWLLETRTGDLDELNLTTYTHPFFEAIQHKGMKRLDLFHPLYPYDFLKRTMENQKRSNVLVTNHAYLAYESKRMESSLPPSPYLVIDEAHLFAKNLIESSSMEWSVFFFLKRLNGLVEGDFFRDLEENFPQDQTLLRKFGIFQLILRDLLHEVHAFDQIATQKVLQLQQPNEEIVLAKEFFAQLKKHEKERVDQLNQAISDTQKIVQQILEQVLAKKETFSKIQLASIEEIEAVMEEVDTAKKLLEKCLQSTGFSEIKWLQFQKKGKMLTLHAYDMTASKTENAQWYEHFKHILYTSGTLKLGRNKKFVPSELGVSTYSFKSISSTFDYSEQVRICVPTDFGDLSKLDNQELSMKIAAFLLRLADETDEKVLVLFSSQDVLKKVHYLIGEKMFEKSREVIAQGFYGSKEKMLKRFSLTGSCMMLGLESFWEGIDLPGGVLRIMVVTRIPFENPNFPLTKEQNNYYQSIGKNPFSTSSMPKAMMKLRQAMGRMIRSQKDKGVLFLLDNRLLTKSYAKQLRQAFPKEAPIIDENLEKCLEEMHQFLL